MLLPVFGLLVLIHNSVGQELFFGNCPSVSPITNFAIDKYLGKWYEQQKYFVIFEWGLTCVTAEYSTKSANSINVKNSGLFFLFKWPSVAEGTGVLFPTPDIKGQLGVSFGPFQSSSPNYNVIGTDYTSYSLVFSCTQYPFFNLQTLWILTRERNYPAEKLQQRRQELSNLGLNINRLTNTDNNSC